MSRRTERVSSQIQRILGRVILAKMSDPRLDPALTSVTRVEMPEDLLTATVYISVADEEKQSRSLAALRHARGFLQEAVANELQIRNTPRLEFKIDQKFKKTMETLSLISEVMEELNEKDRAREHPDDPDDLADENQ